MSAPLSRLPRAGRVLVTLGAITALVFGTALSASAAPAPVTPTNLTAPVIVGSPNVGVTLTVTPGTWHNADASKALTYSWTIIDDEIASLQRHDGVAPTGDTYVVQAADLGKRISVTETATNGSVHASQASNTVSVVTPATLVTAPVLTGDAVSGSTLSATEGAYTDPGTDQDPPQITYEWSWGHPNDPIYGGGNGDTITGATGASYVVTPANITDFVQVTVSATYGNGNIVATTLRTDTVVVPAAPFASDAGLTSANEGGVTGSVTATTATVTIPGGLADGTEVYVFGYSTPTRLGSYRVVGNQIVVNFAALPAGAHKLLVIGPTGLVLGWFGVSVLAATGASVDPMVWYLAGGALLLGALLFGFGVYARRRKAER